MFQQIGYCPRCAAPVYIPTVWWGIYPPPPRFRCNCHCGMVSYYPFRLTVRPYPQRGYPFRKKEPYIGERDLFTRTYISHKTYISE